MPKHSKIDEQEIKVSDKLPENNQEVFYRAKSKRFYYRGYYNVGYFFNTNDELDSMHRKDKVTGWMPRKGNEIG